MRLKRLPADRSQEDLVEREAFAGGKCNAEMAGVGRVKGAAEKCDAHGG